MGTLPIFRLTQRHWWARMGGMPRTARVVVPDVPHHVTQRGNRGDDVFFCDGDREVYLDLLWTYAKKHDVAIHAYCLMTNHVHLVVTPHEAESLGRMLKPVHLRYAQHVNWTQRLTGRLWQGRFFSCALDGPHADAAVRYVERNPVRARMVRRPELYRWSSAGPHCGNGPADPRLAPLEGLPRIGREWATWLREREDGGVIAALRMHTATGRPLGSSRFLDLIERLLDRVVRPRKAGRPRKKPPEPK